MTTKVQNNRKGVAIVATTEFNGGAESYIARLATELMRRDISVTLLGQIVEFPGAVVRTFHGPKWSLRTLASGLWRLPRERAALATALDALPQGLTFSVHFKREQIAFSKLLARRGRVIWTEHGLFPAGPFGSLISRAYRRASAYADCIVCVSDVVRSDISHRVSDSERVTVIESAVAQHAGLTRGVARTRLGIDDRRIVCAFVGRLTLEKRPELAIESALLAKATIIVAGDGPLLAPLRDKYRDNQDVVLLGHADASVVYAAADRHLWTSNGVGEGFPTVLLEAASYGVPTIGTLDSGFDALVLSGGGRVGRSEPAALAELIRLEIDPSDAELMRSWSAMHSISEWIAQYERVFFPPNEGTAQKPTLDSEMT